MTPTRLFATVAVVELLAGVGLLIAPSFAAELLLDVQLAPGAGIVISRIAGAALAALGLVCWAEARDSNRSGPHKSLLRGLLAYNALAGLVLLVGHFESGAGGAGFWATLVIHAVLAVWTAVTIRHEATR